MTWMRGSLGATHGPAAVRVWDDVAERVGASVPDLVRWLWTRFDGVRFAEGAAYLDPTLGRRVTIGWLLSADEVAVAFEDTLEVLPAACVPVFNDGADNHVCIDLSAVDTPVLLHVHDAEVERRLRPLGPSFERFLLDLQRPHHASQTDLSRSVEFRS